MTPPCPPEIYYAIHKDKMRYFLSNTDAQSFQIPVEWCVTLKMDIGGVTLKMDIASITMANRDYITWHRCTFKGIMISHDLLLYAKI